MYGGSGEDLLVFNNNDRVWGGSGADELRFNGDETGLTLAGGTVVAAVVIEDFQGQVFDPGPTPDVLAFASGLEVGSFAYIYAAAFSGGGNSEARFDLDLDQVEVDSDGDGSLDMVFEIAGMSLAAELTATDFVWL